MCTWASTIPLVTGVKGWKEPKRLGGARVSNVPIHNGSFQSWRGRREGYRDIPTQKANIWPLVWNTTPTSASHNPSYISNLSRLLNELTVLCTNLSLSSGPPSTGASALVVAREDPVEVVTLYGSYWTLVAYVLERQSLRTMCSQPQPHVQ